MLYFLINPTYKDIFRLLYRIKGKKDRLEVLFVDGGQEGSFNGLVIHRASYFSLLLQGRKTLKDLILEGYLREYPFSKVVKKAFFVPKLRGDILYYAYLSRGFGEQVYVEGIEEFEQKVKALKKQAGFVDYWDIQEVKFTEPVLVFFDIEKYSKNMLAPLWASVYTNPRKTFIFLVYNKDSPLIDYFSRAGKTELVQAGKNISWHDLEFSMVEKRLDILSIAQDRKLLICEWDTKSLFHWAVELTKRDIPFGVKGDYKGETIVLSTVHSVWGHYEVGFFGVSPYSNPLPYLRAFARVKEKYFSLEDLLVLGAVKSGVYKPL